MTIESLGTNKIPRSHPQSWLDLDFLEAWWLVVCWVESALFLFFQQKFRGDPTILWPNVVFRPSVEGTAWRLMSSILWYGVCKKWWISLDCFEGKFAGNPCISRGKPWFTVDFPFNQSKENLIQKWYPEAITSFWTWRALGLHPPIFTRTRMLVAWCSLLIWDDHSQWANLVQEGCFFSVKVNFKKRINIHNIYIFIYIYIYIHTYIQ